MGLRSFLGRPFFWVILATGAVFALAPLWGDNVQLRESLILAATYIILASNLNLMIGYAHYVNFGSIVFFGLGGYVGLFIISVQGGHPALAAVAAGCVVSVLALCFGLGILKLRGPYFALATIGVNEAVKAFVANFTPWGGGSGMYISIEMFQALGGPRQALWVIYFMIVGVMTLSLLLSYAIKRSRFGLGLIAIGQNEDAAAVLGVPTPLYKALAYSSSAFLPAAAGCLYFFKNAFIQPTDAFDLGLSVQTIVMVMLGGQGTVAGPAIGAFVYEELRGYLLISQSFANFELVITGAVLLLIVTFAPRGIMGWIHRFMPWTRKVLE